ncbi:ribonuclease P protein subunit p14 isoform X2 [Hypanus sabinus]|uniref:ribonuclease P protein subunit p14 isoform X2 n=1 Tax=Hypanus sabinus TaxID=79690 RepID=UPI0028C499E4|nr:ribonuclease P protein subunit p14 isoform X2 [Hypanus sabinus]
MIGAGEQRAGAVYERRVYKNASDYQYMKVRLEFEAPGFRLNDVSFKQMIVSALRGLHGEIGAAVPIDVLKFEEQSLTAILRVRGSDLVKLWSALTLVASYKDAKCAFRVIQVSPFLLALSGNSREFLLI